MMKRLEDLVLFAEVVESGGFSAAARNLGMLRSKLSRRIVELERRMGARLLQRNTRQVSLTQVGEQVYAHARVLAEEARRAFKVAREVGEEPQGLLRIACSATFAAHALVPVLAEFSGEFPLVRFAVDTSDQYVDLISQRADLAFRVSSDPLDDSSLVMRSICALPMMLVASPALLKGSSRLAHPDDASDLDLLALSPHDREHGIEFRDDAGSAFMLSHRPRLVCKNMATLLAAVLSGLGIAVLPRYLCLRALANGQLVDAFAPGSGWRVPDSFVHALMPTRQGMPLAARTFLDFAAPRLAGILTAGPDGERRNG